MKKRLFSLALALTLCLGLTLPAAAAELTFSGFDGALTLSDNIGQSTMSCDGGTITVYTVLANTAVEKQLGAATCRMTVYNATCTGSTLTLGDAISNRTRNPNQNTGLPTTTLTFKFLEQYVGSYYVVEVSEKDTTLRFGIHAVSEADDPAQPSTGSGSGTSGSGSGSGSGSSSSVAPAAITAYATTQTVLVNGSPVQFQTYTLRDANGYDTNYIKLRDLAMTLNDTSARFQVDWNGLVSITTNTSYTPNGSEFSTPYSGDQPCTMNTDPVRIDSQSTALDAFTITDANGGGYTYFKLRDLGAALGFTVDWTAQTGITLQTP